MTTAPAIAAKLLETIPRLYSGTERVEIVEQHLQELAPKVHWQRLRLRLIGRESSAGLCLNFLTCPPACLHAFAVQFHDRGLRRLLQDEHLQAAIAHAYWQTVWAGDAVRMAGGETRPVAFLPLHRRAFTPAPKEGCTVFALPRRRYVVGESFWKIRLLLEAAENGLICWRQGAFGGPLATELLAYLQERAFVDRYVAGEHFSSQEVCIERLIPVSGAHLPTRLIAGERVHFAPEQFPARRQVLAATNCIFFLNFPEEYAHPWDAMNDPVGLLIENGTIMQLPLLPRGTLLVDDEGRARVLVTSMRHVDLVLPWLSEPISPGDTTCPIDEPEAAGRDMVLYTPAWRAGQIAEARLTPYARTTDLTLMFGRVVEVRCGGGTPIPAGGCVLSVPYHHLHPDAVLHYIRRDGAAVSARFRHEAVGMGPIRTAITAGPVLLHGGTPIAESYFDDPQSPERFLAAGRSDGVVYQPGLPPTRFPMDVASTRAPRTVLGLLPEGMALVMVIDGRQEWHSTGATLREAAVLLQAAGCTAGLNLDGGGSSFMYVHAAADRLPPLHPDVVPGIVNLPSDMGHQERLMPCPLFIMREQEPTNCGK